MPRPAAHSSVFKWLSRCERLNDGLPTDSVHFGSFTAKFVHITTFSFVEMRPPGGENMMLALGASSTPATARRLHCRAVHAPAIMHVLGVFGAS